MSKYYCKDVYRYYGEYKEPLKNKIFKVYELEYIKTLRRIQNNKLKIVKLINKIKLKKLSRITNIQIPDKTKIGDGFYIGHCGRIIINPNVIIGKNVNIATGVTIGQENRGKRKGCPKIGDYVWIGTNSVIVGNISIGNNVLIAPNSFVNFDVPDNSIVIGNPGRIKQSQEATVNYIENKI